MTMCWTVWALVLALCTENNVCSYIIMWSIRSHVHWWWDTQRQTTCVHIILHVMWYIRTSWIKLLHSSALYNHTLRAHYLSGESSFMSACMLLTSSSTNLLSDSRSTIILLQMSSLNWAVPLAAYKLWSIYYSSLLLYGS